MFPGWLQITMFLISASPLARITGLVLFLLLLLFVVLGIEPRALHMEFGDFFVCLFVCFLLCFLVSGFWLVGWLVGWGFFYFVCFALFKTMSWYVAQTGLEFMFLLPLSPMCWDYSWVPPHLAPKLIFLWEAYYK
jgi:hypothetical protein